MLLFCHKPALLLTKRTPVRPRLQGPNAGRSGVPRYDWKLSATASHVNAPAIFNPRARLEAMQLANGGTCWVLENALLEPERLVRYAVDQRNRFATAEVNYTPGILLPAPSPLDAALGELFNSVVRRHFDARRLLRLHCRLVMVTRQPQELKPIQTLCHRDRPMLDPENSIQACVLYLFKDSELGGTSFYEPLRPEADIRQLFRDSTEMPAEAFFTRYRLTPGYVSGSNEWFRLVGRVPARWNRCIFFDGFTFHSGDIPHPDRLSADPQVGRLTLNGFFTSRRHLKPPSLSAAVAGTP